MATENHEIYGSNVVLGSLEDTRTINVTTTGTGMQLDTSTLNPDPTAAPQQQPEKQQPDQQQPENTEADKLTETVQQQLKADEDVAKVLADKKVDFEALQTEFDAYGVLSAETYASLDKAGFPRSVVDAYISGVQATVEQYSQAIHKAAGGQQEFEAVGKFIVSQGKAHVDSFNRLLETGDIMQVTMALNGYKAQMVQQRGTNNAQVLGTAPSGSQEATKFNSRAEMVAAINDPKYGRDMAYTLDVQNKIIRM